MVRSELENDSTNLQEEEEEEYYGKIFFLQKYFVLFVLRMIQIHAVIHCCNTNDHSEDSILVEHLEKGI